MRTGLIVLVVVMVIELSLWFGSGWVYDHRRAILDAFDRIPWGFVIFATALIAGTFGVYVVVTSFLEGPR